MPEEPPSRRDSIRKSIPDGDIYSGSGSNAPSQQPTSGSQAIQNGTLRMGKMVARGRASIVFAGGPGGEEPSALDDRTRQLADIIQSYNGILPEQEKKDSEDRPWLESPLFDIAVCAIILLNIVVIGLEMDHGGDKIGYGRDVIWILLEWMFCLIFLAEIGVKVRHYGFRQWIETDYWAFLSIFVASMAFIDIAILSPLKISGLRMLSLIRIVNLLRLKKIIENYRALKELKLVLRGMIYCWTSLAWAVVLLVLIMYVFSIWTTTLMGYDESYHDLTMNSNGFDAERLFGNIGRSMFTLLQVMTLDTHLSGILRYVVGREMAMALIFFIFTLLTTYGIMNLIISIIVEQTLEASRHTASRQKSQEDFQKQADLERSRDIYLLADTQLNGVLSLADLTAACRDDTEVQWRLRQLELQVDDVTQLFQVIDGDGVRDLNMKEFIDGCSKLKGLAASRDLLALQHKAESMGEKMDLMARELQDSEIMLSRLEACTNRLISRFGPTILNSRRRIHEADRGSVPNKPLPQEKGSISEGHLQVGNLPRLPNLPNLIN